jgi:hypothetical protein
MLFFYPSPKETINPNHLLPLEGGIKVGVKMTRVEVNLNVHFIKKIITLQK